METRRRCRGATRFTPATKGRLASDLIVTVGGGWNNAASAMGSGAASCAAARRWTMARPSGYADGAMPFGRFLITAGVLLVAVGLLLQLAPGLRRGRFSFRWARRFCSASC
jgi:hypothetical protein